MPRHAISLLILLLSTTLTNCRGVPDPAPWPRETVEAWTAHVLPTEEEARWASIPWLSSFSEGLRAARIEGKPLVLWAMNGHPLGCT